MWSGENPHEYRELTPLCQSIGVWCGMSGKEL